MSKHSALLNRLVSMQGSPAYAARKETLAQAEQTIVDQERRLEEWAQVWGPVEEYARKNLKVPLGESISAFVLKRLQELDKTEPVPSDTFVCEAGKEVPNAGACPYCGQDENGECKGEKL